MNINSKKPIILLPLLAVIFILGSEPLAFAHRDKGYGYPGMMHYGQGPHHRGYGGPGYGMFGDLTEDQIRKLDEERAAFWEATKDLRQQIYQKRLELASELAKQNPDAVAAATIQQQISDLMAQLAQKHLEHFLRVQKIDPDAGRGGPMGFGMMGFGMRRHEMMGPGMMHRGMMGPGGYGPWDCPWGVYGREPFMMGPAGGRGMGPGMMNRGDDRQYHDTQAAPAENNPAVDKEN
ncbi:MAG: periplasmic heavy metal sensor [Desulfobacterales bacterium]|nr:MAG: periplasmic heavy metal sensor [Desulfobacterales bacterium]